MSRISKWKPETAKVKVVFRLQFNATHIPASGWDKLFISFVPTESGKTSAKTSKANVRNGTCKWGDPIYETTRLIQDTKTKKYDEKLYKLVVSMGSSRASILGEATINLADYADASKPSSVAMPLHGCNSGAILHVTVQLLTSKTGFREFEQQREHRERGLQIGSDSNRIDDSGANSISSLDASDQMDKVHTRAKARPHSNEFPSQGEGLREESADSGVGYDGSSNTSGSLYAEKNDCSSMHEIDSLKSTVSGDIGGLSHHQSPKKEKSDSSDHQFLAQGRSDWVQRWGSDYSIDQSLAIAYEENSKLRGSLEVAESSVQELKMEVSSLRCYADALGNETQKFASSLVAEIASGEELAKEIMLLKSECSKCKIDVERLKSQKFSSPFSSKESSQFEQSDHLLQGKQHTWVKGLSLLEDKMKDVQRKAYLGFDERDFSFLHSDLQELFIILQDIKHGTGVASLVPSNHAAMDRIGSISPHNNKQFVSGTGFDVELYHPESVLQYVSLPNLVSQESESRVAADAVELKVLELVRELDETKIERESLARKMDEMECYYESLVQELEENQKQILGELQNLRSEHSICLYTISTNNAEMESIRKDMTEKIVRFSEERQELDSLNKELQRRVVASEASLKRTRLNYSIAVDQLQKDLELLSFQVLSMFETNENLMKQAFSETSQVCFDGYTDILQNVEESGVSKLSKCINQSPGVEKQFLGGDILVGDMKKSLILQEDIYQKVEEERCEIHSTNLYLDIFSQILKEMLFEANSQIRLMKGEMYGITQQLEEKSESEDILVGKLQMAMEEIHTLNEYKAISISKSSDMLLQNQITEAKLESLTMENCYLKEQLMECELLIKEYKTYQSKYVTCLAEKSELENLLKVEATENEKLQSDISSLNEQLKTLNDGYIESVISKENLHHNIMSLQDKLASLLASYELQSSGQSLSCNLSSQDSDLKDFYGIVMKLEEAQHNACKRIIQLTEEKRDLQDEKRMANMSVHTIRSEIVGMKQKFKHDIKDIEAKLDLSNTLVGKLQMKFESVANKFHSSAEAEKCNAQQNEELFADLAHVELQLQELASKHQEFGQEILGLGSTAEELERCKIIIAELTREKKELEMLLQAKIEESFKLASDLDSAKDSLRCVQDDLHIEKGIRHKLEGTVGEYDICKMTIAELVQERTDLTMLLESKTKESVNLAAELDNVKQSYKVLQDDLLVEQGFRDKLDSTMGDLERSKMTIVELMHEKQDLTMLLESQSKESVKLTCDLGNLKESLKSLEDDLIVERGFRDKLDSTITDLERSKMIIDELLQEKQDLTALLDCKTRESLKLASDLESMKESLRCLEDELRVEKDFRDKLEDTVAELETSRVIADELMEDKKGLVVLLEVETEKSLKQSSELNSLNEVVRCLKNELNVEKGFHVELEVALSELRSSKTTVLDLTQENQDLKLSLEEKIEDSVKLESHVASLNESLKCLQDSLLVEIGLKEKLECKVLQITSQLKEEQDKLCCIDSQDADRVDSRQLASELDINRSRNDISVQHKDCQEEPIEESSCPTGLSCQLTEIHEHVLEAEVQLTFVKTQYESLIEELVLQLKQSKGYHVELQNAHFDIESQLNRSLATETHQSNENAELMTAVHCLRSELEASVVENRVLSESISVLMPQLEEFKRKTVTLEAELDQDSRVHKEFNYKLEIAEEEICELIFCNAEQEIAIIVLKDKLDEQKGHIALMEKSSVESLKLQNQIDEVTYKLSEQILRTEEFKNLSVHLKELKDKAEAECLSAHEKKGPEGPSFAVQESLRIAFIKEQYETKLQELRQQLSISKKHGEEMLWKLQDVVNELDDRKKTEVSYLKRNEELSIKVLELEAELQSVFSDKREKTNAYDRIQTELDCAILNLECCKEEKEKLEASLRECVEEKTIIAAELALRREQLENSISSTDMQEEVAVGTVKSIFGNASNSKSNFVSSTTDILNGDSTLNLSSEYLDRKSSMDSEQILDTSLVPVEKAENLSSLINGQAIQVLESKGIHEIPEHGLLNEGNLSPRKSKDVAVNQNFRAETLRSSIDHLHEELERMKNENSHFSQANHDPYVQDLQRELMHLNKANQDLESMFPWFQNCLGSGNALERVLALEIELAEALRAKKTSSLHIQSSFLKQHSDEEAVLKSFKDINELIKEMLELKAKYASVETELKEMHDRYSDLSLQFAEVEGERQKLTMTLKNIRTPKKPGYLNRSSSETLWDQ
ncbi:uncharacterized protein LOC108214054 [Daucus carota subsp. sativus]|uniref:uncharacterized protein LOC108214054 n=1 Tax=Daucus carota subsp. sativus TaxID=79200 RepID=UPI0007B1EE2F|nr:PREDICTED: golgin subfamily A member 4 [Daucus carota subsp. sativus]XP_017241314.1 PREDICTED: golgin subfamily A member 4 [Daucus carota subsp. sativus]XP_017241315.1 PREDICTED: golgin subfamily A member 4 [Daucus carota subsp. sativus]XP_017241316.1 PREDICTED: golgin subfamily A member 4 [Daucus carota subsp. sativus]XP_017241318.1 PREDICTED: golgin subfamily A member 4 [Daucus carota subsp. sativus]XP_017241319.1 PREDICTED: golgin subfamily A member 4 [Daucus carota subsp. sativus]XP_01